MLNRMLCKYSYVALAIVAGGLLSEPAVNAAVAQSIGQGDGTGVSQTVSPSRTVANRLEPEESAAAYQTLYVDSAVGSDSANGIEAEPLRTVTRALEVAPPNTVIVLAPGRYSQGTGEVFPLQLKPGVTIQGTPGSSERTAIIEGGGEFNSPSRSQQNAAIVAADRAGIAQVAVSNPDGYGVWIESASPTILESAFVGNRQTGIYVVGGSPRVHGSYFSGNQVAGLIVFGASSANIQRNIFDGTGDAIRVLDGATPEIVGNRMTNNDASVVLIGDAQPVIRNNQIVGNRQNDVVEVSAGTENLSTPAELAVEREVGEVGEVAFTGTIESDAVEVIAEPKPPVAETVQALTPIANNTVANNMEDSAAVEIAVVSEPPVSEMPISEPLISEPPVSEPPISEPPASEPPVSEPLASEPATNEIPAGAPGAALQALRSGLALGPRAVTGENPEAGSLIRNRRRRPTESTPAPEARPAPPVNNNRLAVPNTSIPIGSGSSAIFSPPSGGSSAPPAPPSRAQALGLYYRVFVEASDPFVQDGVRQVVPDAFRTQFEGRTVMQVGAFPTEGEAEDRRRLLEDNDFDVRVEYIR